jgi:hypothetical protein
VCLCTLNYPVCKGLAPYCIVICLAVTCFSTLFHKQHDFRKKKVTEKKVCVFISPTNFPATFPILRRIQRDIFIHTCLHIKYPLFLSDFGETWIFSTYFPKILKYQIAWRSFQWEPSYSMRTDEHDEAFRNIANAPINEWPWGRAWILCQPVLCQARGSCNVCSTHLYRYMYISALIPYRPTNKLDFCNSPHSNQRDSSGGKSGGVGILYSPLILHYSRSS